MPSALRRRLRVSPRSPLRRLCRCAPSSPDSSDCVAASSAAHSVPSFGARARRTRERVSDYSWQLGPPLFSPSLIKEQFVLSA